MTRSCSWAMGRKGRGSARSWVAAALVSVAMLPEAHAQGRSDASLTDAVRRFESALRAKDVETTLAAWQFEAPAAREAEEVVLRGLFSAAVVSIKFDPPGISSDGNDAATRGTLAQISEPRGSLEQWGLLWKRGPEGWRIVSRESFGGIDGLVHLILQKEGFVAAGQTIELEDFTLKMMEGTFFLNTQDAGPTALVFVGRGRVSFKPRPQTERGQMKIFAKREALDDTVSMAFLRLHPADLYRVLRPGTFAEDPESGRRYPKAFEFFERHKGDAFVLDAAVPGAPWWLLPNLGDAAITFKTARFGSLTLSLSGDSEGISLFNRGTGRQISVYSRAGVSPEDDDAEPALDVVHHDLAIGLNPSTFDMTGRDTLAIDVRVPVTSLRFHLDDGLVVKSVRSAEAGGHLFFRIRGQNSVLVFMGALSGKVGRLNLTVDYVGRLPAGTVESEILQGGGRRVAEEDPAFFSLDPAYIYSKRRWFYPQPGEDDYATSRLSVTVPAAWSVVAGGKKSERLDGSTRIVTHEQGEIAKYIAFVVTHALLIAAEQTDGLSFAAYGQPRTRRDALLNVEALKTAARYYSELFGPLPYSPVNMVLIEAVVPGGHSPAGLLVLQQRPPLIGGALKDDPATFYDIPGFFLAHELAHQWWGQGVTPRSYRDRWVAEGFAQYAAALWARESQGEEVFERVLRKMVTWARRLSESGPVDLGTRVGHIRNDSQAHRAVVYDKGALVLDLTRRLIGDEAFRQSLLRLQREHRFKKIDSEAVRRAFETESAIDLDLLWEAFVRNTSIPTARVETNNGAPEIVVTGYAGPLPLTVEVDGKRAQLVVRGRSPIPNARAGSRITLDPAGISLVKINR